MLHSYVYTFVQISVYLQLFSSISRALLNLPTRSLFSTLRLVLWHLWHLSTLTLKLKDTVPKLTCLLTVDHWGSTQSEDICSWGAWWEGKVQMLRPRFLPGLWGVRGGTASQQDCKPATDSSWKSSNRRPLDKRSSATEDILRRPVPPWPACMRLSPSLHTMLSPDPTYFHL